jgi:hypothetical protein
MANPPISYTTSWDTTLYRGHLVAEKIFEDGCIIRMNDADNLFGKVQ